MSNSGPNLPNSSGDPDRTGDRQKRRQRLTFGQLGEDLAADWLQSQGGRILERRWHCRRGEIDLIALMPDGRSKFLLAFVEVKTRSGGSWDEGGLLSLTPAKQRKLWHSARLYLSQTPRYAPLPCRFDLALIHAQVQKPPQKKAASAKATQLKFSNQTFMSGHGSRSAGAPECPGLGQPVQRGGYRLTLQHYLTDAFRME